MTYAIKVGQSHERMVQKEFKDQATALMAYNEYMSWGWVVEYVGLVK